MVRRQDINEPRMTTMINHRLWMRISLSLFWALACLAATGSDAAEISFLRDVAPILTRHCTGCHGPTKVEGDYRLHTFQNLLKPGSSESPAVTPGKPLESELYLRLIETDEASRMPQLDDALPAADLAVIEQWIASGAKFDGRDPQTSFKSQMPPRVHPAAPEVYRLAVPLQAAAFSPDGRELALGGHHEVTIWNPESGALLRRIGNLPKRIQSIAYESDGKRLLVGGGTPGDYGEVVALDSRDGSQRQVVQTADDLVLSLALSHDGAHLVTGSADRQVRSFRRHETGTWEPQWESRLYSDWVTDVAFGSNDQFVLVACRDYTAKVLTPEGTLFTTYNGHQRQFGSENGRFEIYALAAASDGPRIFTAGQGRSIRVWEADKAQVENGSAADMEERFAQAGHTRYLPHDSRRGVYKLAAGGRQLFAGTGEGIVRQFDLGDLKLIRDYPAHDDWIFTLAFHPQTQRLATGTRGGRARVWNTTDGRLIQSWMAAPGLAAPVAERR